MIMNKPLNLPFFKILLVLVVVWSSYSCVPYKKTVFLNEKIHGTVDTISVLPPAYEIQPGDLLSITVHAPDPNSVIIFNRQVGTASGAQMNEASLYVKSYEVSDSGNVTVPLIGDIHVKGLTIKEISSVLKTKLEDYYNHVEVDVKMVNFLVTLLGEVGVPGTMPVYNTSYTLLQALANAGMTEFSDLTRVQVVRQMEGKTFVTMLDLTDSEFMNSDFYYLHPNDVVIVRHFKAKFLRINTALITVGISILTLLVLIRNISN